ncbi:hypothetical protein [Thermococcus sp. 21S7]|uniref:hypothetical protein n=1 Tax=Thermococcus sp. 21S7 TaxID=1638221 RepID=UPI00143C20CE|nr:hypothetical protein [Thermococcus sp. 21S7]NJE62510.1 hypothetical protein [Thermococcus sp. 21S7]
MRNWKLPLLLGCFIVQLAINLFFCGFPVVVLSAVIPNSVYSRIAWSLPILIIAYFLLAMAAVYYLGISPRPKRGRLLGSAYFALGVMGSALALLQFSDTENPLISAAFALWLVSSIAGVPVLWLVEEKVPEGVAAAIIAFLGISAFISAATAQWMVTDYYIHVHMNDSIPENASVIVAYPENASPPSGTG